MRKIVLIAVMAIMTGCSNGSVEELREIDKNFYYITTVDGCEYVACKRGNVPLVHHGGCSNPIHQTK